MEEEMSFLSHILYHALELTRVVTTEVKYYIVLDDS